MLICGIDEAGRGCLAGSLFVAGVVCDKDVLQNGLENKLVNLGIKDSKKLSKKKRYELKSRLNEISYLRHFLIEKTASEIDTKGLSACLKESLEHIMQEAINTTCQCDKQAQNLPTMQEIRFYFDGNSTFGASVANALNHANITKSHHINATLECVIKGDEKIPLISCASIYAKCAKDTQSESLDKIYPQYDLATNAGYGTKSHIDSIKKHGLSPAHRASFCAKFVDFALLGESGDLGDLAESSAQKSSKPKSSNADFGNADFDNAESKSAKSQKAKSIKCPKNTSDKNQPCLF